MTGSLGNILIDARALQTGFKSHKFRGIGHYAKNYIRELMHNNGKYSLTFLQERGLPIEQSIGANPLLLHKPSFIASRTSAFVTTQWSLPCSIHGNSFDLTHYLSHADASFLTPGPYIVSVMDTITLSISNLYSIPHRIKHRILQSISNLIVHHAAMIIAISEHTKKDVVNYYGTPPEKVVVIPLAAEERFFDQWTPVEINDLRARYGLPETFILYVGGIDPRKNVEIIFKAMRVLLTEGKNCPPLVFAGHLAGQREYPGMMRTIRALGVEQHIRFLGYVPDEDLPLLYRASLAFVYPSRYEGFGLPVLQAMASGTPVITTKLSSIPEVAGNAALYIDPDDPVTLAKGITVLLTNSDVRASLISDGKRQAGTFSWQRTLEGTLLAYREVLERQRTFRKSST